MKQKPIRSAAKKPQNNQPVRNKPAIARPTVARSTEAKAVHSQRAESILGFFYGLILLGYSFITVLTPNLNTLDSNGPKFYTLALLNMVAFILLLVGRRLNPKQEFFGSFFRNRIGFVYTLFLVVSLISFSKAINIHESILHFSKLFTVFSAAVIVSVILREHRRYLYLVATVLSLLLIYDSLTVFYSIIVLKMNPSFIISIYSNKNILASSIFVKIAFVLWLIAFGKWWVKIPGFLILVIALLALLYMKTRAFYIGSLMM